MQKAKTYLVILSVLALSFVVSPISYALQCTGREDIYVSLGQALTDPDMGRTAATTLLGVVIDGTTNMFGQTSVNNLQKCAVMLANEKYPDVEIPADCSITAEECAPMLSAYNPYGNNTAYRGGGGLIGLLHFLDYTTSGPLPVDAAYAWNRNVEKIPFARTALAAPGDYSGPYLDLVYDIAQISKDIALAIIGIIMLVVGIMIITGKKISAQASVTLQLALPRIAMAIVLIFFSYTIGAVGASIGYNLRWSSYDFIETYLVNNPNGGLSNVSLNAISGMSAGAGVIVAIAGAVLAFGTAGLGIGVFLAVLIGALLAALLYMLVWFKFAQVYFNILVSIITAPITFAIGAIPGNDGTSKWFKGFAANILSLPAMGIVVSLSLNVALHVGVALFTNDNPAVVITTGAYAVLLAPIVIIFGLSFARSIPEKMQAAFGVGAAPAKGGGKK